MQRMEVKHLNLFSRFPRIREPVLTTFSSNTATKCIKSNWKTRLYILCPIYKYIFPPKAHETIFEFLQKDIKLFFSFFFFKTMYIFILFIPCSTLAFSTIKINVNIMLRQFFLSLLYTKNETEKG